MKRALVLLSIALVACGAAEPGTAAPAAPASSAVAKRLPIPAVAAATEDEVTLDVAELI